MKRATPAFDVVTLGAAVQDIFVRSSHFENVPSDSAPDGFNACLPLGAKIPVDELVFTSGGGATNAATTFARFGLRTACIARVGDDLQGKAITADLKHEKINITAIQHDVSEPTACSIILLAGTGSRAILTARGASRHIDFKEIDWNNLRTSWLYLTSLGNKLPALKTIFQNAKKHHMHVAWNPGNSEIELGFKTLAPFLLQTDILIMNREEASAIADVSPHHLERIVSKLGPLPRMALVITDGKHGAFAHTRGVTWVATTPKIRVRNTTGAGDAFGSAFCASIMKDGDLTHALQIGTLNAQGVVSHMGAKTGILQKFPSPRERDRVRVREHR